MPRSAHDLGIDTSLALPRALKTRISLPFDRIAGSYALRAVAGHRQDSASGSLVLERAPRAMRGKEPYVRPFQGSSTLDLNPLGPVSLAYPASQDSSILPGVQFQYDTKTGYASLAFGAAESPRGAFMDAGVTFYLAVIDSAGMRGWWENGGRQQPHAWGYFCARRL
jgi:hypothetical protein